MPRPTLALTLAGLLACGPAAAEDTAAPGRAVVSLHTDAATVAALVETLARPELIQRLAKFSRAYYEALLAQGFTQDQAIRIVVGTGVPGLP